VRARAVIRRLTRGHGFRDGKAEVMGSESGTHDLALPLAEPISSGISAIGDSP
jgi:hypothetical protein